MGRPQHVIPLILLALEGLARIKCREMKLLEHFQSGNAISWIVRIVSQEPFVCFYLD